MHLSICMDLGIPHREAALCKKDFHFRLLPPEHGKVHCPNGWKKVLACCAIVHSDEAHESGEIYVSDR